MTLRHFALVTHRWFGLAAAIVLSIAGCTGALLIWDGSSLLRKAAGKLHENLAVGPAGHWIVVAAGAMTPVIAASGLTLWWRRKVFSVRLRHGWRRALFDLHHVAGVLGLVLMLLLGTTAVGMAMRPDNQNVRRIMNRLHTSGEFPTAIKIVYLLGTVSFAIQSATGVIMWWRLRQRRGSVPKR